MTRDALDLHGASSREIHRRVGDAVHGGSAIYELDEDALETADADLILTQELCAVCAVGYREVNEAVRALELDVDRRLARADVRRGNPEHDRDGRRHDRGGGRGRRARRAASASALGAIETKAQERREARLRRAASRGPGVARPAVLRGPLGPRPDPAGRRLGPARPGRRPGPTHDLGRGRGRRPGPAPAHAVRLPPRRDRRRVGGHATTGLDRRSVRRSSRGHLIALDGSSYFSRPGPRVVDGIEMLAEIFDPEAFRDLSPATGWTPIL